MLIDNHFAVKGGEAIPDDWIGYMSKGQDKISLIMAQKIDEEKEN